jgi:glycosyltransferase involved in cell wall biosynthesis
VLLDQQTISVIIPTKVNPARRALLKRAIESVLAQEDVRVVPIVVINGSERDPELTSEIIADRRFRVVTLENADLPAALRTGREMVDTRWFAELDDDDLLMPRALISRLEALNKQPEFDLVVTNGVMRGSDSDKLNFDGDVSVIEADPLRAMLRQNWLLPGSWLCRSDSVGIEFFTGIPRYRECTYLGLQFATRLRIKFLNCPTVVYHTDTPQSESKSQEYALGVADATRRMLELDLPADVRDHFRMQLGEACSANAYYYLQEKDFNAAWAWYRRSLRGPRGWRRSLFARRFAYALLGP